MHTRVKASALIVSFLFLYLEFTSGLSFSGQISQALVEFYDSFTSALLSGFEGSDEVVFRMIADLFEGVGEILTFRFVTWPAMMTAAGIPWILWFRDVAQWIDETVRGNPIW